MIVLLATVVVVCGGIVIVAVGRGGQIAEFTQDTAPLELPARRPIAGTDVALLRLPTGPWGYSYRATDDALRRIAHALTERDTRIAVLEQQISELRSGLPGEGRKAGDSGSPWFDRSASFEGRRRPVSSRTGEAGEVGTPEEPVGAGPADDGPEEVVARDGVPEDAAADAWQPFGRTGGAFADAGRTGHASADAEPEPSGAAGPAWVVQKAWTPGPAWTENGAAPKPAEPADDEPESETAEADEDWAFEDDAEPAAGPSGKPTASALGFSTPAPWPGDRLVATSRPRTKPENTADEKAGTATENAADETAGTGTGDDAAQAGVAGGDSVREAGHEMDAVEETAGAGDGAGKAGVAGGDGVREAGRETDGVEDAVEETAGTAGQDGGGKAGVDGVDEAGHETDAAGDEAGVGGGGGVGEAGGGTDAAAETGAVADDEDTAESKADEIADGGPHGEGH